VRRSRQKRFGIGGPVAALIRNVVEDLAASRAMFTGKTL
jgi:hypothetical protein